MSLSCDIQARRGAFELAVAFDSPRRVVAVEGPSGAGKTTLLYALAGLLPGARVRMAVDGAVLVDTAAGVDPPVHRRRIGFVFQDVRLFPHMTVAANIGYGRSGEGGMGVAEALALMDLQGFGDRWPRSLSGGEARRVALARALCADPAVLLLDEPFTGLDEARREALLPYLVRLRDETALPMLLVSHDPRDAAALAQDRVTISAGRRTEAGR
ncbi:MAG: ATP-binding cassette domain-containing protein [Caulobacter sp.]|jgi:molybdate transport system ATP-binding protein